MPADKQFDAMHREMKAWIEQQERDGWQSPEIEHHARRVLLYLWECAHNKPPHHSAIKGLADETEALARSKAKDSESR